ncbi:MULTISPECIES: tryptophan dimethylallyltransferase family protein [Actinokineospora]|uniref:Prenyltransferase n=1 Tax=Actinokineospora fastidiosa TaxID=1816 RepID=A0A918LID4_9PSEU|nr:MULTISPECIES: tryptophan dimethylallyltransferase family protein [Actinokineospora]UVS78993.1 aromatic prenyltransferase, DMATS type [Actinokineospora sp. UTMC 2448]GGS55770.1 prenyltransferase [Actinokineospora fastidiosa]
MSAETLGDHVNAQLRALGSAIGLGATTHRVRGLLDDLLGAAARWPLTAPRWSSDVADDHSPIEYSVAFAPDGSPTLRLLVECVADDPSPAANQRAALAALDRLASRLPLCLDRFSRVAEPFLADTPAEPFSLWFSLVARPGVRPMLKVYLNPLAHGRQRAPELVGEALDRLGFTGAERVLRGGLRDLSSVDHYSFFALDLDDRPDARAKVYVSQAGATRADAQRAAAVSRGGDPAEVARFCLAAAGSDGPYTGRPLVSSYTFLSGDGAEPSGYSLYVPVRDYVTDDLEALNRTRDLSTRYGVPARAVDAAVSAVLGRDLRDGPGLIAHLSLRTGPPRPGMTVYLSAESYAMITRGRSVGAA